MIEKNSMGKYRVLPEEFRRVLWLDKYLGDGERDVNAAGYDMREVDLDDRNVEGWGFYDACMIGMSFLRSKFLRCSFNRARVSVSDFRFATLEDCTFRYADLTEATADGSSWSWCDLRGADLSRATFKYAQLLDCKMTDAQRVYITQNGGWVRYT